MRHRPGLLIAVLFAVGILAGCAPNDHLPDQVMHADEEGPFVSSLQVEVEERSVLLTLQVTNADDAPIEVEFTSGQMYDFAVRGDGREVWRWSDDRMFTQALHTMTLEPGETRTFQERWTPGPDVRGNLVATGALTSASHPLEQEAEFEVR